jgi:DNA polymerase
VTYFEGTEVPPMPESPIDLAEQLRAHLESLRAAGVLFVPRGELIAPLRIIPLALAQPAPEPEDPLETRRTELAVLETEVTKCDRCKELFSTRLQTVFGTGPLEAEVAFVGEAPGPEEDAQGEPFVGKGGQVLGRIIAACGFTREHAYLFNAIKCRPPKNRTPTAAECGNCRDFFRKQFDLVQPKHVVALGQFVARLLSSQNATLAELRGTVHQYRGVPLVCTHHPNDLVIDEATQTEKERAAAARRKRETWEDMQLLLRTMGRAVPGAKSG